MVKSNPLLKYNCWFHVLLQLPPAEMFLHNGKDLHDAEHHQRPADVALYGPLFLYF